MSTATASHDIMERASEALVQMRYAACERLCLQGLAQARSDEDWIAYYRALRPLQETRRQRRQMATDLLIRFGSAGLTANTSLAQEVLANPAVGCMILTYPHTQADAADLLIAARSQENSFELLYAASHPSDARWCIASPLNDEVTVMIDRPEPAERWERGDRLAHQFVAAGERLGDEAMRQIDAKRLPALARLEVLEQLVETIPDHEKLHQALAHAAKNMIRPAAA